jgi:hypothetical protein
VFFGGVENFAQQFPADIIGRRFAMRDACLEVSQRCLFELEIAGQHLSDVLADQQLAEVLQIGQTVEQQDALDQAVGMFHLFDRLIVLDLAKAGKAPVGIHPRMQKILVDRGQLIAQLFVEPLDHGLVALHGIS